MFGGLRLIGPAGSPAVGYFTLAPAVGEPRGHARVHVYGDGWTSLPAAELPSLRRIGPWTAGAAAADWSNDFAVYPYGDLAVRTWAAKAAPHAGWPGDEHGFRTRWERAAGPHLANVTLLTLAWGGHYARTVT
jgi:hypothetical protein